MVAPRCPQVHRSADVWEKWIEAYIQYRPTYLPRHLRTLEAYKTCNVYIQNMEEDKVTNNWKYNVYEWLTGKKHRVLTLL